MEEKDDIFKFEDFLGGNKIDDLKKMKSNLWSRYRKNR